MDHTPATYHASATSAGSPPNQGSDEEYASPPAHTDGDHVDQYHETNGFITARDSTTGRWSWRNMSKEDRRRLYWIIPLVIVGLVLAILFEVYKSDIERWVSPLADWLRAHESWSWVIPVAILFVLSFPPLFGHEIIQIVVGLTYPLGVAIGISCAGSILGEAGCFIVFKYFFTGYVDKRIRERVRWAAVARLAQQTGFRGVLVIRYSIVPPHLANPLFSCTGMKFWVYMTTVILSLPKTIVFVALGAPSSENSRGAKVARIIAIGVLVVITIYATRWIRKRLAVVTKEIEAERAGASNPGQLQGDEEMGILNGQGPDLK